MADNTLIEHFYLMISLFRNYDIIPIFVFDGKPPKEKRELLLKRRKHRKESEDRYNKLKEEYDLLNDSSDERIELRKELDLLKRETISISYNNIETIKTLITAYGAKYEQAEGESDVLCVQLVNLGKAWGCMSDDMDMFLYGCPRVLRHVSLVNHTGILYDTQCILDELNLTYESFRDITILSGTDYNIHQKMHLYDIMKWYNVYLDETVRTPLSETLAQQSARTPSAKQERRRSVGVRGFACEDLSSKDNVPEDNDVHFYDWLTDNTNIVVETSRINKIRDMFNLDEYKRKNEIYLKQIDTMSFRNREVIKPALVDLLESDGFIFVA